MTDTPTVPLQRPAWQTWCAAFCVALLTFAVFFSSTRFGFVGFDDADNVYNNTYLNPVTSHTVSRFWSEAYYELYTPVTYTLWTAIASLPETQLAKPVHILSSGDSMLAGPPFHLLGVSLHVLNSVLLFFLLLRLPFLRGRSPVFAALGAALWAVHPLQAESVSWVTGHNNVFSGVLMLAALLAFVRRIEAKSNGAILGWYLLATIFYALALLAKPTAAALPLVAFALAVGAYRQPWRSLLLPLGAWFFLAAGLLFVIRNTVTPVTDVSLPLLQRPFVVGDALAFYAGKILLPIHLGLDYGRQPEWLRTQTWFYATWLVPVAIGGALLWWYRRTENKALARTVMAGFAVFVLGALPMLGLAPYYFHHYSTVADRYVYLALIGAAIAVAVVLAAMPQRSQSLGVGVAVVVVLVFGFLCHQQSLVWHDSLSLFLNTTRVNPGSQLGHYNTSLVLRDKGDNEAALREVNIAIGCRPEGKVLAARAYTTRAAILFDYNRYTEAIHDSEKSIDLSPEETLSYINLAIILWKVGEPKPARATLERAANIVPVRKDVVFTIGAKMLQYGIPQLGMPYIEEAANGGPQAGDANYILGVQAGNRKDNVAAEKYLRAAVRYRPEMAEANYSLGRILERRGNTAEAQVYYQKAAALGFKAPKPVQ